MLQRRPKPRTPDPVHIATMTISCMVTEHGNQLLKILRVRIRFFQPLLVPFSFTNHWVSLNVISPQHGPLEQEMQECSDMTRVFGDRARIHHSEISSD